MSKNLKNKILSDPEVKEFYDAKAAEYKIVHEMIKARLKAKLSQDDLAKKLHTTQSAVARLESGKISPSFKTLQKYANATGNELLLKFVSNREHELTK